MALLLSMSRLQAILFAVWILFCLKVITFSFKIRLDTVCGASELEFVGMCSMLGLIKVNVDADIIFVFPGIHGVLVLFNENMLRMWGYHGVQVAYESMVIMNVTTRDKFFYEVFLYYNPLFLMVSNVLSFTYRIST